MRLSDKIKNISNCLKSKSNSPQPMHKNSNSLILMKSFLKKADSKTLSTGSTPNANIRQVADSYAATKGIKLNHDIPVEPINTERATKIAHAYEAMPHTPNDPHVKKAYSALINETKDQFHHIMNNGLKISKMAPGMPNPYPSSKHMMDDIQNNNHLWYFPTDLGFGDENKTKDHPLETQSVPDHEGKPMLANDMFRVVHDYFGHAKEGVGFGPKGEDAAYKHHHQMYSPDAQKALAAETRMQNSTVNFGSNGEWNRKNPKQTKFADQKAVIAPDWVVKP